MATIVYRDADRYCSHPCITRLANGEWLVAFSISACHHQMRHPPDHPWFWNALTRTADRGATWSEPAVTPGYDWYGVETPGIAQISTGDVLLNQWRFRWYPVEEARARSPVAETCFYFDEAAGRWAPARTQHDWDRHPYPYARADDGAYVHVSNDNGRTWSTTVPVEIAPYQGAFSPKGVVELSNGDLLLALGSHDHDPLAASIVVRSSDQGRSWQPPVEAARAENRVFSEPSIAEAPSGKLLLMSREEVTGLIHQSESVDAGSTWSEARPLPIWGYPTHCTTLQDGRMAIVYGHRRVSFGIRAALSVDEGATWGAEIIIRDRMTDTHFGWNLGYPSTVEYEPGRLFVAYYGEDGDGVTCIQGSFIDV